MTVINALRFNEQEGAIVADEQSSTSSGRKYDIAEKLHQIEKKDLKIIYGGSGASNFLYDIHTTVQDVMKKNNGTDIKSEEFLDIFGKVILNKKITELDSILRSNYNVSYDDLIRGYCVRNGERVEIASKEAILQTINKYSDENTSGFLMFLKDNSKSGIYIASTKSTIPQLWAQQYASIGSGSDMGETILYDFIKSKTREERINIDPIQGIIALLDATDVASKRNSGVGGTPSISIVFQDKIYTPSEINSKLASELVKARKAGCLRSAFVNKALEKLIFEQAKMEDIEADMWKHTKDSQKLSRVLRGYFN